MATYIAVKCMTYSEVNMTLSVNRKKQLDNINTMNKIMAIN